MAYRRRRYENDSIWGFMFSLISLYFLWMTVLYFSDRAMYWQSLEYSIIFAVVIIGTVIGFLKFWSKRKKARFESILNDLRQNGLESEVNSFIESFGLEKKTGKPWRYDRYTFSWEQLERFRKILNEKGMHLSIDKWDDIFFLLTHYIDKQADRYMRDTMSVAPGVAPRKFNDLPRDGQEFENLLHRLFDAMGYSTESTGKKGDYGCDLVVNMGNDRVVVQAKCYSGSVGPDAIREANAAKTIYNCNRAMVVTSSNFTKEAFELAWSNHVELIDKEKLSGWLLQYLKQNWK